MVYLGYQNSSEVRILEGAVWYKTLDLQRVFKTIRTVSHNENWKRSVLAELNRCALSTAPFGRNKIFGDDESTCYVHENDGSWKWNLLRLRVGLMKSYESALDDYYDSPYYLAMQPVFSMEGDLSKFYGVYDRKKFEEKFRLEWKVEPGNDDDDVGVGSSTSNAGAILSASKKEIKPKCEKSDACTTWK